jgi:acetolactate synthase-1/2/3 large subunit
MNFIESLDVRFVFYLPGGGSMHLNDSLGRSKLNEICMLHEQAAAVAAEAYARITENFGVCLTTSGPGAANAITGLAAAWLDSTPVFFISGQVKRTDLATGRNIRQFGIQEIDIISMVRSSTKYAIQVTSPEDIRYELEKAAALAMHGKPGPVWIDIPLDVQAYDINPDNLKPYVTEKLNEFPVNERDIIETIKLLNEAERPILILGNGIRLSGASDKVDELVKALGIPVLTSWNGVDLIDNYHDLYYGRPGAVGLRYSNFIQQNSDFALTIGTRLNLLSTGFDYPTFLRGAKHVMVEIDKYEMEKESVKPYLKINNDAGQFISAILSRKHLIISKDRQLWINKCNHYREKYDLEFSHELNPEFVDTYKLMKEISEQFTSEINYQFTSSGTAADIAMQVLKFKKGQRAFLTKGLASMGFDLPASIGNALASDGKKTICVTGDGGFMMNIQELETLRRLDLPVKIFVVSNSGYSMIYSSQYSNFEGRLTGCTAESGLTIPDLKRIVEAFSIECFEISNEVDLELNVKNVISGDNPAICIVKSDIKQKILPRQANYMKPNGQMASRPLEDMVPLLDRDELEREMII